MKQMTAIVAAALLLAAQALLAQPADAIVPDANVDFFFYSMVAFIERYLLND